MSNMFCAGYPEATVPLWDRHPWFLNVTILKIENTENIKMSHVDKWKHYYFNYEWENEIESN